MHFISYFSKMSKKLASLHPTIILDYTDINPQNVPLQFKCLFKLSVYLGHTHKNQRPCQLKAVPPIEIVVCSWLFKFLFILLFSLSTSTLCSTSTNLCHPNTSCKKSNTAASHGLYSNEIPAPVVGSS